jgi:hypothetical protein
LKKSRLLVKAIRRERQSPIPVSETPSTFIRVHDETLTAAGMCVSNEDCYGSENATRKMPCILKSMRHLAPLTLEALSSTML